ncbi:unnamed protein product [Blepharisma stoltei]|uniref:SH3 domain-containing protein n=1 Tax=Blepharisma stoltei TaxID=1481888 RepID=A0AAU9JBJ7_9CILI|nr:unnamed protein product [Blepharisma stoltei]
MSERSRTPSPNQTRNLERGVFSSLSTLTFIKSLADERKPQSVSTTQIRTNGTTKPKSPIRNRPNTSPSAAKIQRVERSRTPDDGRHSPLRVQNGRTREDLKPKEDDSSKLQDVIKKLTAQLVKEKKENGKLEAELRDLKQSKKNEFAQTQMNLEKLQKTVTTLKGSQKALTAERERLTKELEKSKDVIEITNSQIKSLADALVVILGSIMSQTVTTEDEDEEEKLKIAEQIQKIISEKLSAVMTLTSVDLNQQLQEVKGWTKVNNMPRQITKEHIYTSDVGSFRYLQEEEPAPISYTVEYFEDSPEKNSSQGFSLPFKSLKVLEPEEDVVQHPVSLSERIINKIRGEEVSFNTEKECARALYDFDGERDGDLSFSRGDIIEVLQKTESGWWTGKLGSQVGSFPYNFVQQI